MARFGSFELDTSRRQLCRAGQPIHLAPKAFDLLKLLIDAAPRVLTKTELHQQLWPSSVVSDASLTGLVKDLRRALDDNDRDAPVIRTVHRVGYAFCRSMEHATPLTSAACGWLVAGERRIPLVTGENIVGRDPACRVWLDFATVSRRHARIVAGDAQVELEDLGSKNGTQVRGKPLTGTAVLRDGDEVRFGHVAMTYRASTTGLPTAPHTRSNNGPQPGL